ncbi:MAG: Rne/Rng family ribonuclease [Acidimicrobiales bacterium]
MADFVAEPLSGSDGEGNVVRPETSPSLPATPDPGPDPSPEDGRADETSAGDTAAGDPAITAAAKRRRRGSRGGRSRNRRPAEPSDAESPDSDSFAADSFGDGSGGNGSSGGESMRDVADDRGEAEGLSARTPMPSVGDVRRPRIGDTRPAPPSPAAPGRSGGASERDASAPEGARKRRRRGGRGRGDRPEGSGGQARRPGMTPVEMVTDSPLAESDPETMERRRGRERKGRPVGRYLMVVHKMAHATHIAILEGRVLIEHYVSRAQDDANQIDGNIYVGRVQNVLPGMEAAFIDIATPKNAVLYRGDVRYDPDDVDTPGAAKAPARIEELLKQGQMLVCQVTKNPIAHKGARLTQEVSLPGRFVVLIPNSATYGISKRLSDDERKRLRRILDDVRPANHGLIVRTAAEGASADELRRDVARLASQWEQIDALARSMNAPGLVYREPDLAVRVIREEFNKDYRGVVIDDAALYADVRDYVGSISPELADRVEYYDVAAEMLPVFERHHVHEQLHRAIDRKVWLPSGGSLIIERTEALTVIDVNTGKNVGTSNLEETVYRNNLEAADEIAKQLRLRDIGGIIVIDFIDMEIAGNRADVIRAFRAALARDKTRTQIFDISELGLVEMTRKRVSEGLVESLSDTCPTCEGRGMLFDASLLE